LVGNQKGRDHLGKAKRRWKYNIKIDHKGIGCEVGEHFNDSKKNIAFLG
jgi:hypothetical protein